MRDRRASRKPQPGDLDWEDRAPELAPYVEQLRADGLGSLFDLTGTSDRAKAREELAPKFRVIEDATGEEKDAVDDAALTLEQATLQRFRPDLKAVRETVAVMPQQRARILAEFQRRNHLGLDNILRGVGVDDGNSLLETGGLLETHNYVTDGQFDELVRRYSDVRLGRNDLQIDTSGLEPHQAAKYRAGVMSDLGDIMQTRSGRELTRRTVDDGFSTSITIAPNFSRTERDHSEVPYSHGQDRFYGVTGSPTIRYATGQNGAARPGQAPEYRSDQTLYHELTHVDDARAGLWEGQIPEPVSWGDAAEHMSGRADLRREYAAMGVGPHRNKFVSDRRYAEERRELGMRPGVGDRTKGIADAQVVPREDYTGEVVGHWVE
jgi:hypothetical protein